MSLPDHTNQEFKFQFIVLFGFGNCRPFGATAAAGRIPSPGGKVAPNMPKGIFGVGRGIRGIP